LETGRDLPRYKFWKPDLIFDFSVVETEICPHFIKRETRAGFPSGHTGLGYLVGQQRGFYYLSQTWAKTQNFPAVFLAENS